MMHEASENDGFLIIAAIVFSSSPASRCSTKICTRVNLWTEVNMDIIPDYNLAPRNQLFQLPKFNDSMERCFECATSCWISADAFIGERDEARLRNAIEACLNCAEVCARTVRALATHTSYTPGELEGRLKECIEACRVCAKEASGHCGEHEHCWICVKTCEECLRECEAAIAEI